MLTHLSAEVFGVKTEKIMPFAVALECIHTYSLIHDDLPAMDNDDMRRGRPTVHKVYGEAMAILAGDKLENLAYEILHDNLETKGDILASKFLSSCAGAMVNGQSKEMSLIGRDWNTISTKDLFDVYSDKTTALIRCAIMMPYYISGGQTATDTEQNLLKVAENIGLIFQLVDDLLDTESGTDAGKITYVNLFGEENTKALIADMEQEIEQLLAKMALKTEKLMEYAKNLTKRKI